MFTVGKNAIKKTSKIVQSIKAQTKEEQLDLINFYFRSPIIHGVFLPTDKAVKDSLPATIFGNIPYQAMVEEVVLPVPYKIGEELEKVRYAHRELGVGEVDQLGEIQEADG